MSTYARDRFHKAWQRKDIASCFMLYHIVFNQSRSSESSRSSPWHSSVNSWCLHFRRRQHLEHHSIESMLYFWNHPSCDGCSMVTFTLTMRRHLIRFASASFISSRLATFGWVRFPCATRGKHNAEFTKGGWELWSYFKPFMDQSSQNFQTI